MNFQNPSYTPAAASQRIRILWQKFELSQAKDRAQLDLAVQAALEKVEAEWIKTPINVRTSKIQRNANKAKIAKRIKAPYFDAARAKWHDMLEPFGLKPDYWTDLTEDEKRRIINALGAEDESDEDVVVPESPAPVVQPPPPPPPQSHFFQPLAPSFSTSSRATNLSSSSYAFVNPSEFNSEEEDFEYEIPISNPVATSVDLTSEDDDDPVASIPNYPGTGTRASLLGSAFSRASLSASNTPSARPLVSGFAYNAASTTTGPVPTKRPPQPSAQPPPVSQNNESKSTTTTTKARIPRQPYVGPTLDTPADEPIDEELEFEKFKMRTRMAKIVEFHEAAALAEISLSIEMYKARKQLNNSKEEDAPRVLEHQKRMVQLQKEKEEERKAIVKSERARRQSELARRRSTVPLGDDDGDVVVNKKGLPPPKSNGSSAFKTWDPSSFQDEINLPSRFNLETLLTDDPAKQQTNVESLLNEMFAADDDYSSGGSGGGVNGFSATPGFFNGSSSSAFPPNPDTFRGSSYQQEQLLRQQSHSSMSWNHNTKNSSPQRKTHLSPFGESSDEEEDGGGGTPAAVKPNAHITTNGGGPTPVNGAWSKKTITTIPSQPRQGSNINPTPSFFMDDYMEPEPTATPFMNSKAAAKGKKFSVLTTTDKSPVLPPPSSSTVVETPSKAPAEAEVAAPPPTPAAALAPAPAGKKQTKKQRLAANKKGGGGGAAAAASTPSTVAAATPEQEPETAEPFPQQQQQQRESPNLETPVVVAAPNPIASEHQISWLPKTATTTTIPRAAAAAASARMMDSEPPSSSSFSWDEITSTPRPASKIPAHVQESLKSAEGTGTGTGTVRPMSMLKKKNLMAEIFSSSGATSSRTTLEQMTTRPVGGAAATPMMGGGKGPVWGSSSASASASASALASIPTTVTPGPSLWGKTKKDFEPTVVVGGDPWVPGGFDGVVDYKDEGDGGGGGGGGGVGNEGGGSLWGSIAKQNGKSTTIPVKQPVAAAQRLRRVSEAAATSSSSSPALRGFGTKDLSSDNGKQQQHPAKAPLTTTVNSNSNSKKAVGKKNGKGKQRATIEVVSDEEKDNIDILPQDSNYIMEPTKPILEPKPSVPSYVYNPIIDFAGGAADDEEGSGGFGGFNGGDYDNNDDMNDIAYMASTFRPTASSSSQDDFFSSDSLYSNPFKSTTSIPSTMGGANTAGTDWGSMMGGGGGGGGGGGKHARWTPNVNNFFNDDGEDGSGFLSSFPSVSVPVPVPAVAVAAAAPPVPAAPSRLQQQATAKKTGSAQQQQQTPIWGQPNPSAKDKGKGKKK